MRSPQQALLPSSKLVLNKFSSLNCPNRVVKNILDFLWMGQTPFKFFKFYTGKLFFVVDGEKVHVVIPVGPSLLFGSRLDALDLFLLLSLSLFYSLFSFLSNKSGAIIGDYYIYGRDSFGWRWFVSNYLTKVHNERACLVQRSLMFDFQVSQLDVFAVCIIVPSLNSEDMLTRLGVPAWEYWETVLVFLFNEAVDNDPIPNN